jgi:hypothetical protein
MRFGANILLAKGEYVHYYLKHGGGPWESSTKVWGWGTVATLGTDGDKVPYVYRVLPQNGEKLITVKADQIWGKGYRLGKDGRKLKIKGVEMEDR